MMNGDGIIQNDNGLPKALAGFSHVQRYWDSKHNIYAAKILPGEFYVTHHGELITTVLGSCVSACVRDVVRGVGGMNHFMLPDSEKLIESWKNTPVSKQTRYGNIAMEQLINLVLAGGGRRENLEVKLFGGGRVIDMDSNIGKKNIEFVRKYLKKEGLRIVAEDVLGDYPRKIQYFPLTGRVRVKKLYRLHNDTFTRRERKYIEQINEQHVGGKIDLFG